MPSIKIVDVINHKNKYSVQTFIVIDREPVFLYEKESGWLIAEDSGFFNFYGYKRSTEAFYGRKFDIPMLNGDVVKASGQWWHGIPGDYQELVSSYGVGTVEGLGKCNVFSSTCVDPEILNTWLNTNEPSNNYDKYRKGHKNFGVHRIVSQWDD